MPIFWSLLNLYNEIMNTSDKGFLTLTQLSSFSVQVYHKGDPDGSHVHVLHHHLCHVLYETRSMNSKQCH